MSDTLLMLLLIASPILLFMIFGKIGDISDNAKKNRQIEQEKSHYRQGLFDSVGELHDGIAIAKIGKKYTYVKQIERPDGIKNWKIIGEDRPYMYGVSYQLYISAQDFSDGAGIAQKENGLYVLVDERGFEHCESKYISVVGPNLVSVKDDDSDYSLANKSSGVIIASGFKSIGQFKDNRSIVEKRQGKTVIDAQGNILYPYFEDILLSTDDSIIFTEKYTVNGWTSSNYNGNILGVFNGTQQRKTIECEYAIVLHDPTTRLWLCGQRLAPSFRSAYDRTNYSYRWKVFNSEFMPITDWWNSIEILNNEYLIVSDGRKQGLCDFRGEQLLPCSYESIYCSASGKRIVARSKPTFYDYIGLYEKTKNGLKRLTGSYMLSGRSIPIGSQNGGYSKSHDDYLYEEYTNKRIHIYEDYSHLHMPSTEWAQKSYLITSTDCCPMRLTVAKEDERPGFIDRPGKKGVLSISKGCLLIPCDYDDIEDWGIGIKLIKEGKTYWLDSEKLSSFSESAFESLEHKTDDYRYLFFDTETTGKPNNMNAPTKDSKSWPHIVQLSWLITDKDGRIISKHNYVIRPDGFEIPSSTSKIHGITQENALEKGVPLNKALYLFLKDTDSADFLVGHNIDFDCKMISAELNRIGAVDLLVNKTHRDTMKESAEFYGEKVRYGNYKWPTLQELYIRLFSEGFANAHDSSSDVEATYKCFWELVKRNVIDSKKAKLIIEHTAREFTHSPYEDDYFFPPDDEYLSRIEDIYPPYPEDDYIPYPEDVD